jgi:DNA-binding transcriptional regulator WhiA
MHSEKITKSGLNHRLRKLVEIGQGLRGSEDNKNNGGKKDD